MLPGREVLRFMSRSRKYRGELLERGVGLTLESKRPIAHITADLGINAAVLRRRVRQADADQGLRKDLLTSEERKDRPAALREPATGERELAVSQLS